MFLHVSAKDRIGIAVLAALVLGICITLGYRAEPRAVKSDYAVRSSSMHRARPVEQAQPGTVVVHIVGAVKRPGVYTLKDDSRVQTAVQAAGGFSAEADREGLNLASRISDGEQIRVPKKGEAAPRVAGAAPSKAGKLTSGTVSLNTATAEELEQLPGVGPATAEKIVQFRTAHGSFTSIDQLREVGGIGTKKLDRLAPFLRL